MECVICHSAMKHLVLDLHICDGCHLVSSDIGPDATMYDKSYHTKYSRYEHTDTGKAVLAVRRETAAHMLADAAYPHSILDYGCGTGSFVRHMQHAGACGFGYDLNPYSDYCDPVVLMGRRYDLVTLWDVIEHVKDPVALLAALPSAAAVLCTPCIDDHFLGVRHLNEWHHYYPSEHVHLFGRRSLEALFAAAGYRVVLTHYRESDYRKSGGPKNIITMGGVRNG